MDEFSANPFVYESKFTNRDYGIFALMLPIAIIKIIIIIPCLLLLFISSFIFYYIKQIVRPTNYYEVKHYYIAIPMFFMKSIFYILGVKDKVIAHNSEKKRDKANLYVIGPHSSLYDVIVILRLGITTAVARDETKNVWILSKFILLLDPILVKRDNPTSRQETIRQIKIRANYEKIAIFPEGTCTNRSSLIKFRLGAFTPGLPVQPIYLDYQSGTERNTIWCHEGLPVYKLIILTMLKWETLIRVHLLPVYSPTRYEIEEPWQYGMNVQNYFSDYFNLRRSLFSFEDPKFLPVAKLKGIPRSPCCLKFIKICYKIISTIGEKPKEKKKIDSIVETNSIQSIAIKLKKGSIGSINSMMDKNLNWIEELDIFIRNFVFFNLEKFDKIENINSEISSTRDLFNFLELDKKYPAIEHSSTFEDFFNTITGLSKKNQVTYLDIFIILTLCNIGTYNLRDRIDNCIAKMEGIRKSQIKDHTVSYRNFRKLIWHLLGIDESYLPDTIFKNKKITSEFFNKEIVQLFRTAVTENAPDLIDLQ